MYLSVVYLDKSIITVVSNMQTFARIDKCGSVYEDRPAAGRYYTLGSIDVPKKDAANVKDIYFVLKEGHCLRHNEPKKT